MLYKLHYKVQLNNGPILQCYLNTLHIKSHVASLPHVHPQQGQANQEAEAEQIQEAAKEMEEVEHLPHHPEEGAQEAEAKAEA